MIYDVHWDGLVPRDMSPYPKTPEDQWKWHGKDPRAALAEIIKTSPQDTFVMITVPSQEANFKNWMTDHKMEEHMFFEMKQPVQNGNYPDHGRKLLLRVFKAKKENK